MKKNLLLSSFAAFLLFLTFTACVQQRVTGSKNYITKNVKVGNFEGIKLSGSSNIIYTQKEGVPSVEIYGSDNLIPLLETFVENGNLVIKYKKDTSIRNGKMQIKVSAPAISLLSISGSSDVKLANGITTNKDVSISVSGSGSIEGNKVSCSNLAVKISGSGDLELKGVAANHTKMTISGSGDADITGNCTDATYKVSGSGNINAKDLKTQNVDVHISGSGAVKCYATETLRGSVSGSGSVGYKGTPRTEFFKKGLYRL